MGLALFEAGLLLIVFSFSSLLDKAKRLTYIGGLIGGSSYKWGCSTEGYPLDFWLGPYLLGITEGIDTYALHFSNLF